MHQVYWCCYASGVLMLLFCCDADQPWGGLKIGPRVSKLTRDQNWSYWEWLLPCEKARNRPCQQTDPTVLCGFGMPIYLSTQTEWDLNDRLNCIYQMHASKITEISNSQLNEKAVSELWAWNKFTFWMHKIAEKQKKLIKFIKGSPRIELQAPLVRLLHHLDYWRLYPKTMELPQKMNKFLKF